MKSQFIGKDPDAGKDRGQEENRMTEDEVVGWHPQLNGHEFEQALGVGDGQEAWRAADMTELIESIIVLSCLIVFLSFCTFSLL